MMNKLKQFIYRYSWVFGAAFGLAFISQVTLLAVKNQQINALVQENADLRSNLDHTEEKISNLIAIQKDIRFFQYEIDSWFKDINKNSLVKFSNFIGKNALEDSHKVTFASLADSFSTNLRLDKLELSAHQEHFHISSLINKTQAIKNFMLKIPSLTPAEGYISSHFGSRFNPVKNKITQHHGIDIAGPIGDNIFAAGAGEVITATYSPSFGRLVEIKHGFGFISRYGHLHEIKVKKGQRVAQGQVIGHRGNSGASRGPHLHYEVHKDNKSVDPMQFMVSSAASNFF